MSVHDVAAFVLDELGEMTSMKLQKLVYYAQSWSLVWREEQLFDERFEAWANGPVSPDLYARHRGQFRVSRASIPGDPTRLSDNQKEVIKVVLDFYGNKSAQWLSDLTHLEAPWNIARDRAGVSDGQNCNEEITHADMHEYYSGLQSAAN
ncbi:Panacea domain-containing protein [Yoonia algicola]|uniref:Type II toxin-antitoxin system antitoxin SocA domain-containing protein n=1 Tax=Yoonia algicola TaxID=3137368 RepID=A0AAN0M589_9RHOB